MAIVKGRKIVALVLPPDPPEEDYDFSNEIEPSLYTGYNDVPYTNQDVS